MALNNVNLSEYFWVKLLHANIAGLNMFVRELPGILLVLFYVGVLPGLLAHSRREVKLGGMRFNLGLRKYYEKMGPWPLQRVRDARPRHVLAAHQDGPALDPEP